MTDIASQSRLDRAESTTPLVESVHSALRILLMLKDSEEIRITSVSEQLGVAKSTAHRLLGTLAYNGFVEQDPVTKCYRRGRALADLGFAATEQAKLIRAARPHVELLAGQLDETVNLLALEGSSVRFIDGVEGENEVRVTARVGFLRPANVVTVGKVLLAELSPEHLHRVLSQGLTQVTANSITSAERLEAELVEIRRRGYAINIGESNPSIHAIGMAVRSSTGVAIGGVAVSVPSGRGGEPRLLSFLPRLKAAVGAIEQDLD